MDFTLTDDQLALRSAVRDLAEAKRPAYGVDSPVGPPPHDVDSWRAIAEMGLLGMPFGEAVGGDGASAIEAAVAAGELGRAGVVTPYAPALFALSLLAELAADQQPELISAAMSGEALVMPALSEPMRAFSLSAHEVVARSSGDGWALTGVKDPVPFAAAADYLLVTAALAESSAHAAGKTFVFLVDARQVTADLLRLDATAAVLLGDVNQGEATAQALQRALGLARVALMNEAVGLMDTALTATRDYLMTRKQFGVPLAHFQALTFRAADMYVSLELARSCALYAAMVAADDPDDGDAIARAWTVVGKAGQHIGEEAIQLHGGIGVTNELGIGHLVSRLTAIEHTYGDRYAALRTLAARVADHPSVEVIA